MAAAKPAYIPRFLLPQFGQIWRIPARAGPFTRPLNADLGQVLVRYASTTSASKTAAAKKVESSKAASTKATPKATRATPATTKAASTKTTPTKAFATKAADSKSSASEPAPAEKAAAAPASNLPKSLVLEKPDKFRPPSHGSRLPKNSTPRHYGGSLSAAEVQAQKVKDYPGLPPPENTWAHWFFTNKTIHLVLTLGTLTGLAIFTFVMNFKIKSPFVDMIPPFEEFKSHPISYLKTCVEIIRLHEAHQSAITTEKRKRQIEDMAKRNEYRQAHGLPVPTGFESMFDRPKPVPVVETTPEPVPAVEELKPHPDDGKRKKIWGIF